jgi:hypothetical protein
MSTTYGVLGRYESLYSSFGHKKIPNFANVCVKGCMYHLFFKPDEAVMKVAD